MKKRKSTKKKSTTQKRYQQPTKSWSSRKYHQDEEETSARTPSAFRSGLRNHHLSSGQRLAFTPRNSSAKNLAGTNTPSYMRPTKNWERDHESPFHRESFASSTKHFLGTFRRAHLTEGQKFAFGAHANVSATRTWYLSFLGYAIHRHDTLEHRYTSQTFNGKTEQDSGQAQSSCVCQHKRFQSARRVQAF